MPDAGAEQALEGGAPAIDGWSCDGVFFERYHYPAGAAGEMSTHAHADYQWCLNIDAAGEYDYRGACHPVPPGSVSILHPGEAHRARDPFDRATSASYLVMYVPPRLVAASAGHPVRKASRKPFFAAPVIENLALSALFARAHLAARRPEARLEHDALLARLLRAAIAHQGARPISPIQVGLEPRAVQITLDYIEQHYAEGVSLHRLADLAAVSPAHLNRAFSRAIGVPPHRYQLALRVDRARRLLAGGATVADAALSTGFADQSHLTRHFRRTVGVTPGRYRALSKNVQDAEDPHA